MAHHVTQFMEVTFNPPPPPRSRGHYIEPRIHVKIALNVVNAWNLVQIKFSSCTFFKKNEMGAFRKFSAFVCLPIWQVTS